MALSRRSLGPSLAASLALVVAAPAARGLAIVEEEDTPRARALLEACEARSAHERLVQQLVAEIEAGGEPREAAIEKLRAMSCPLCGCSLGLQLPGAPRAPGF